MAGLSMRLTLQISDPSAIRKLRAMDDRAKKRLNIQLANAMRNSTLDRFRRGVGPDEQPWEPIGGTERAAATADSLKERAKVLRLKKRPKSPGQKRQAERLAQRRQALYKRARAARKYADRHVPLNDTGRLRTSITTRATANEAVVGTMTKYARIHQYGGETGRRGARFIMKARPYFGFNAEDRRVALAIVQAAIKETILP